MLNDLGSINDENFMSCFNNTNDEDLSILNFFGGAEDGHLGPSYIINNHLTLDFSRRTSSIECTPSLTSGSSFTSLSLSSPVGSPICQSQVKRVLPYFSISMSYLRKYQESSNKSLREPYDDIFGQQIIRGVFYIN